MGTTIALWWKRKKRGNRITAPPLCALNHCGPALCRPGAESGAEWKPLGSGRRGKCVGAGSRPTRILPMEPKRSRKEKRGLRERPPLNFPRHGFLVTFLRKSRFICSHSAGVRCHAGCSLTSEPNPKQPLCLWLLAGRQCTETIKPAAACATKVEGFAGLRAPSGRLLPWREV